MTSCARMSFRPGLPDLTVMSIGFEPELETILRDAGQTAGNLGAKAWGVGGVVRDAILGHPNKDVDITVVGDAAAVAAALATRWNAEIQTHPAFSTATVRRSDGYNIDIVLARSETYPAPGALPLVSSGSLQDDLLRRDYSVNAMTVSLNGVDFGEVQDPLGGLDDLRAGVLRALHAGSFRDDPTRLFRGARYAVRYHLTPDVMTDAAARAAVRDGALDTVSSDRLGREVERLCEERGWAAALEWLNQWGVWSALGGEEVSAHLLRRADTVLAWAARSVSDDIPGIVEFRRLAFLCLNDSRLWPHLAVHPREAAMMMVSRENVLGMLAEPETPDGWRRMDALEIAHLLLALCCVRTDAEKSRLTRYITEIRPLRPGIRGVDLLADGAAQGPGIGLALRETLDAVRLGLVHGEEAERRYALRVWKEWKVRRAD